MGQSTLAQLLTTAGGARKAIGSLNVRVAGVSATAASLPLTVSPAGTVNPGYEHTGPKSHPVIESSTDRVCLHEG